MRSEVVDPYAMLGESEQSELKIGTFVRAEIQGLRADNVIVLPRSVLRPDDSVLVANARHKLEIRSVDVLRAEPETVYISSGLRPGELVISTVMDAPIPGTLLALSEEKTKPDDTPADESQIAGTGEQK